MDEEEPRSDYAEKGERQPGQTDADSLRAAANLIGHRRDEAMSHFGKMQEPPLDARRAVDEGRRQASRTSEI